MEELDVEKADAELRQLGKLAGEQVRMRTKMKTIMTMTMENKRMRIKKFINRRKSRIMMNMRMANKEEDDEED